MQVAPQIHALFDALAQAAQIPGEEVDAVGIVNLAVQVDLVVAGQAVFGDVDGAGVALVDVQDAVAHHLGGHLPLGGSQGEACRDGGLGAVLLHRVTLVDVHAHEVRLFHLVPVGLGNLGGEVLHHLGGALGEAAEEQGVHKQVHAEHPVGGVEGGLIGSLPAGGSVHPGVAQPAAGGQTHHCPGDSLANPAGGLAVGKAEVEVAFQRLPLPQLPAGGMGTGDVAQDGDTLGLVQGHVGIHPTGKVLRHQGGISAEGRHNVPVQPAALVLQGAGQIPVIQGNHGPDARFQQGIDQLVIEGEALLVYGAVPVGDNPGPAHGEAVGLDAVLLHQGHILCPAVVAVAGHVAGIAVEDVAGHMGKIIPDIGSLSVFIPGTLALVGGAGYAPQEVLGKHHTVTSTV